MSEETTTAPQTPAAKKSHKSATADRTLFLPEELTLVTDKSHPLYDERINLPIEETMVANIMAFGVIEPVIGYREGEKILIGDGRQRVKHTAEANKRLKKEGKEPIKIQVAFRRGVGATQMGVMIAANTRAADDGPMVRAKKASRYIEMGRTEEDAAIAMACSHQTIKNYLALLECCAKVQAAVESGKVPAMVAKKLHKLPVAEQEAALAEMLATGATKGARANAIADKATKKPKKAKKRTVDVDAEEDETDEEEEAPHVSQLGKKLIQGISKRLKSHPFDDGFGPSALAAMVLDYVTGKSNSFAEDYPWHATGEGKAPAKGKADE